MKETVCKKSTANKFPKDKMLISSKLEQEEKFTVAIITDISKKLDKKTK